VSGIVGEWFETWGDLKWGTKFRQQYQEAEEYNQTLPDEIKYPTYHSSEIWHSKPINTEQITKKLTEIWGSKELDINDYLTKPNIQEDPQEQSSHQAQIEIPLKK
jgi:hypothetical protein